MKDDLSQKYMAWKYVFCMFGKDGISFSPKGEISGITEKDDIHPRKDDIGILD